MALSRFTTVCLGVITGENSCTPARGKYPNTETANWTGTIYGFSPIVLRQLIPPEMKRLNSISPLPYRQTKRPIQSLRRARTRGFLVPGRRVLTGPVRNLVIEFGHPRFDQAVWFPRFPPWGRVQTFSNKPRKNGCGEWRPRATKMFNFSAWYNCIRLFIATSW